MSNHLKDTKLLDIVKVCKEDEKTQQCLDQFLEDDNWIRITIKGDGNCFFRTLAKHFEFKGFDNSQMTNHVELRNNITSHLEKEIEDDLHVTDPFNIKIINKFPLGIDFYSVYNNSLTNEERDNLLQSLLKKAKTKVNSIIKDLKNPGVWNVDSFDYIPEYTAQVLGVRLNIYDVKAPVKQTKILRKREQNGTEIYNTLPSQPPKIMKYTFVPEDEYKSAVDMLRVGDGHYELLYPKNKEYKVIYVTSDEKKPRGFNGFWKEARLVAVNSNINFNKNNRINNGLSTKASKKTIRRKTVKKNNNNLQKTLQLSLLNQEAKLKEQNNINKNLAMALKLSTIKENKEEQDDKKDNKKENIYNMSKTRRVTRSMARHKLPENQLERAKNILKEAVNIVKKKRTIKKKKENKTTENKSLEIQKILENNTLSYENKQKMINKLI